MLILYIIYYIQLIKFYLIIFHINNAFIVILSVITFIINIQFLKNLYLMENYIFVISIWFKYKFIYIYLIYNLIRAEVVWYLNSIFKNWNWKYYVIIWILIKNDDSKVYTVSLHTTLIITLLSNYI